MVEYAMVCVKVVCHTNGDEDGKDMDHSSSFLASPAAFSAGMLPAAVHSATWTCTHIARGPCTFEQFLYATACDKQLWVMWY